MGIIKDNTDVCVCACVWGSAFWFISASFILPLYNSPFQNVSSSSIQPCFCPCFLPGYLLPYLPDPPKELLPSSFKISLVSLVHHECFVIVFLSRKLSWTIPPLLDFISLLKATPLFAAVQYCGADRSLFKCSCGFSAPLS